ncbi:MAG: KpsF/GutQ family sugar-phosphate isomerase [Flavobacteriales bacterium]|nr:KpsF/GutQ family sugar-phosphate isomerase [Flavobacteriales bacterium]MDP4952243.1 KpsF/GutQ family sugar-phosphate isomerase [Flavobacteriales bacterium]
MEVQSKIQSLAIKTLKLEAESVLQLTEFIDNQFESIVDLIHQSNGRLVVTGIGKSANIAQKMVATFNSTGTPSMFMHAADAIHGDLGIVQKDDIVICISKSGNSPEIKVLAPLVKSMGNVLIGMVGNLGSDLAAKSDFILNTTVRKEACPNNLAPTSSTTAQLAMGDALAVCLMEKQGFSDRDFARYHPGGALGKRLFVKMNDLLPAEKAPAVDVSASIQEAIVEISAKRQGATAVIESGNLLGIVTDGDLRRMLHAGKNMSELSLVEIMTRSPKSISGDELAVVGFELMEKHSITQLIVTDEQGKYSGIVHLHDILREGIF